MSENKTTYTGGIGFFGLLTIVLITLKLLGKIDWRWRWVLSPLAFGPGLWVAFVAVIVLIAIIAAVFD